MTSILDSKLREVYGNLAELLGREFAGVVSARLVDTESREPTLEVRVGRRDIWAGRDGLKTGGGVYLAGGGQKSVFDGLPEVPLARSIDELVDHILDNKPGEPRLYVVEDKGVQLLRDAASEIRRLAALSVAPECEHVMAISALKAATAFTDELLRSSVKAIRTQGEKKTVEITDKLDKLLLDFHTKAAAVRNLGYAMQFDPGEPGGGAAVAYELGDDGRAKVYGHDHEHEVYTREDWRGDVARGDTVLGYNEWVLHNVESAAHDEDVLSVKLDKERKPTDEPDRSEDFYLIWRPAEGLRGRKVVEVLMEDDGVTARRFESRWHADRFLEKFGVTSGGALGLRVDLIVTVLAEVRSAENASRVSARFGVATPESLGRARPKKRGEKK